MYCTVKQMYIHFKNVVYLEFCDKSVWRHISCLAWEIHVFHFAVLLTLMRIFWNLSFNGFVKGRLYGLLEFVKVRKSQKSFFLIFNSSKKATKKVSFFSVRSRFLDGSDELNLLMYTYCVKSCRLNQKNKSTLLNQLGAIVYHDQVVIGGYEDKE